MQINTREKPISSLQSTSGESERELYASTAPLTAGSLLPGASGPCDAMLPVRRQILIVSFLPSR